MPSNTRFVSIWGNAVSIAENKPEAFGKNITLRYPIHVPFDGEALQITFDNYCGTEPVTLSDVTLLSGGAFYPLFFSGENRCTIAPTDTVTSDALSVQVTSGSTVYISFYLPDYTQMRSAVYVQGALSGGIYAIGNETKNETWSIDTSRKTNMAYFLTDVSILSNTSCHSLLCYGDSITAQDWPDALSLRIKKEGIPNRSVIRKATSGSRILRQYSCITYESYGLKGTNRFLHEVPGNGTDRLIIQQGINDIIHPVGTEVNPFRPMSDLPTIDELVAGYTWYLQQAKALGLHCYVGTLLPIKGWRTYAPFREELRGAFNDFLRCTDLADGCIDFDLALRDPACPEAFLSMYDSGDHLHPSTRGYEAMAECIPREILI